MAYNVNMVIKETYYFAKTIKELMSDDLYAQLQRELVRNPDIGALIPNSGGLRKVRWKMP